MTNPNYKPLVVDTFDKLAEEDIDYVKPVVDGFLPGIGAFLFCGSSKLGKSWLALLLGLKVCKGEPFWGYDVKKTSVLYLCLEDGRRRLQDRMFRVAEEYPQNFYFTTEAMTIDTNLIKQLEEQMKEHPDIGLIIIDSLAAIRGEQSTANGNMFYDDYHIIRILHEFTQQHNITILLIHHVRKNQSADPFEDISGSNGLHAASDGAFVMRREDSGVKLYHRHRDMAEQVYTIEFDHADCVWKLLDVGTPEEDAFKTDHDLKCVMKYLEDHDEYEGLAQDFCDLIGARKKAQSLSGKLSNRKYQLEKMGIIFEKTKTNKGMVFRFSRVKEENAEKKTEDSPWDIPEGMTADDFPIEIFGDEEEVSDDV
ncbi:MAG: helicase RepA family protein [Clostridia bacterium]|nr:helicase RepA family protein [Clostridia bacterium]